MFRIVRTRTLRCLDAAQAEPATLPDCPATDSLIRAEHAVESLQRDLAAARARAAHAEGELTALRAQHLLDTEDRAVLRALLRTTRKKARPADRVHVLFRHGALHSIHATHDGAESAAEAEGARRDGWTAEKPGAGRPPATEVPWRIQALPLCAPLD